MRTAVWNTELYWSQYFDHDYNEKMKEDQEKVSGKLTFKSKSTTEGEWTREKQMWEVKLKSKTKTDSLLYFRAAQVQ